MTRDDNIYTTVALFGANGQIGSRILHALTACQKKKIKILAFIAEGTNLDSRDRVDIKTFDLHTLTRESIAKDLKCVDVVISALNGPAIEAQSTIQDAAADVGVKRFYPSEYGFHQIYWRPGDPMGYIHPAWNSKAQVNERAILHPAVCSGAMTFTMIGCGDFYNQDRERVWCPWTQSPDSIEKYRIHTIGDPDAEADYTYLDDFAEFLVATLLEPDKSANQFLNVIAKLLREHTGKEAEMDVQGEEAMHEIWEKLDKAPKELTESAFSVDFWYLVKLLRA